MYDLLFAILHLRLRIGFCLDFRIALVAMTLFLKPIKYVKYLIRCILGAFSVWRAGIISE